MNLNLTHRLFVFLLLAGLIAGCASYRYTRRASDAAQLENWDAAVYYYLEALARDPGNVKVKMELQRARLKAGEEHFRQGMRFQELGDLRRAESELELAVQLDPTHQYAEVELGKVRRDLEILSQKGGQEKLEAMKKAASEMKVKPPVLNPASSEPMTLNFPNPTNVKDIYRALGQAFGINILFDPRLKDQKITIELKDVTARKALEDLMQAAGHFYKVLDNKTVMVAEDTPQNRRDYEDLVVKTFFLSNADVKEVNNTLRALIDARRIAVNEQLNSIVIRDTADKVAIAERLIKANDKAKAELLVDVELIQVDSSKMRDIGETLSSYSYPVTFDPSQITGSTTSNIIPLNRLGEITRSMWGTVVPSLTMNLIKSAGEAETLAQPQLRITEGEKASLVIGDRVPIPTTTFNTTQTVGGNIVPITAFQYQDVGIKIEVEPRVHHNNEVTLKLQVEVSELGENVTVAPGQTQPKIGTRTINSTIRLKDGETSLLAGLFKYNKQESRSGIPWLSDIPIIGPLFGDTQHSLKKTDLILTLTPHIIRNPDITEEDLAPIWVGTENRISIFGNSPRIRGPEGPHVGGPFDSGLSYRNPQAEPENTGEQPQSQPPTRPQHLRMDPRTHLLVPQSTDTSEQTTPTEEEQEAPPGAPLAASATSQAAGTLAQLAFYPARLPVVLGTEGILTVVLDPGSAGISGPIHLAYDPARLTVTQADGGELPTADGQADVTVTQTPALGWITLTWNGTAVSSGNLVQLHVRPQTTGEIPVILAGPIGEVLSQPATVVALPAAPAKGWEASIQ
jgi:general secretion pathway protein D